MRKAWNKGINKTMHPSVMKISQTMRRKKLNNFAAWQDQMRREGVIKSSYPSLQKNGDLAELIGVILGDGYIGVFPRSEVLRIVSSADNAGFIKRYAGLVGAVFGKKPYVAKRKSSNAVDITIYEKHIGKRLALSTGARGNKKIPIPRWISNDRRYCIRYLRGLYEAEGTFAVHKPTGTYKFIFTNKNDSLLKNVLRLLKKLGFHPYISANKVQLSRREEVYKVKKLVQYRMY